MWLNAIGKVSRLFQDGRLSLQKYVKREGIALAKARGAYKGRVRSVTDEQINAVRKMVANGVPLTKAVKKQGISRATAYRYFKERDGK